jgi:hypothetical protein
LKTKRFWNWGVGVATAYAIFAGATLGFAVFAMGERVDLVSDEYYANARNHDGRQAAASRALALGDTFRIEANDSRTITIVWPAGSRPASGEIRFYRPSDSSADRHEVISPDGLGRQVLRLDELAPGAWTVQCEWAAGGSSFYAERQIVLK